MANNFDPKVVSKLADILTKSNLSEIEYEDECFRIKLKGMVAAEVMPPVVAAPAAPIAAVAHKEPEKAAKSDDFAIDDYSNNAGSVKSPIVGVVYLSPDPTKPDYVTVGDTVKEGDIVCLIEAMKTFNPVKAHRSGTVTKILVESGDPVEYGESLMIIE